MHEAGYGVQVEAGGGVVFSMPDGKVIPQAAEKRSRGNVFAIMSTNRRNGLEIAPQTPIPRWHGERMDHDTAVEMLM
jgi:hypothetical protein